MSRPPNPVMERNMLIGRPSLACSGFSARLEQVAGVALEQPEEQRARETDDVEVVAFDPLDEAAAEPLDRVRAGPPLPLAARDVRRDRVLADGSEGDERLGVPDDLLLVRDQA